MSKIEVLVASEQHLQYVDEILADMESAAKVRGTGIAKRSPEYVQKKMLEGKAIIALSEGTFVGFCYIESWGHNKFVANSGLIVRESYRGQGIARLIKEEAFKLSRLRFPDAKLFGLTTGLAVMKINTELGYRPVTFSELTDDEAFWKGCQSCVNYDILTRTNRNYCLCTGMLFDPKRQSVAQPTPQEVAAEQKEKEEQAKAHYKHRRNLKQSLTLYERWMRFKQFILLNGKKTNE